MIISVSRRTDIPAFYSEWFFNRLREKFVFVKNPFNYNQIKKVSLAQNDVDCFVFWTRNPYFVMKNLKKLEGYPYYFLFTITGYGKDIEPNCIGESDAVKLFSELSKKIGSHRVVWRYDPIVISPFYTVKFHKRNFEKLIQKLSGYTETCIISFLDVYRHNKRVIENFNLRKAGDREMHDILEYFKKVSSKSGISIRACAEDFDVEKEGIGPAACVDKTLIETISGKTISSVKDKGQRPQCSCVKSIDIGMYDTCKYNCIYCYACKSQKVLISNSKNHDPNSPILIGTV